MLLWRDSMGWLADISTIKNGPYRIHDYVQNESIRLWTLRQLRSSLENQDCLLWRQKAITWSCMFHSIVFLSVNTGRPHMTSSWIYRKGSVSEEIRKPLVYTIMGELQNLYSLWFSEVAVAVVTCCLRWYFHVIGKENRKAACDLILYRVEGKSLTNSIRGYPEVVSCHWDRKMKKLLFTLVFVAFIFYVSSWSYVRKPAACFRS